LFTFCPVVIITLARAIKMLHEFSKKCNFNSANKKRTIKTLVVLFLLASQLSKNFDVTLFLSSR
jgi:hypothetical protein